MGVISALMFFLGKSISEAECILKFDRSLGSNATESPVKSQSEMHQSDKAW